MINNRWLKLSTNASGARFIVDSENKPFNLFGMARSQICEPYDDPPITVMSGSFAATLKILAATQSDLPSAFLT